MPCHLEGSYAETCSCELMCPCNLTFDHGATYDYCRAALAFNIRKGEVDGTDVTGLKAAFIIDTPKVMTDGDWRLGVFIDEKASETGEPARLVGLFHPVGSELTAAEAKRSRINAFGIEYEGKTGLSTSKFSWAA